MAVSIVGVSSTATWAPSAGTPFQPPIPAGVAAGDVFVVPICARAASITISPIAGYTMLTASDITDALNITGEITAKIIGSSEPSPSVDSSIADTQPTGAVILTVRGAAALGSWVVPAPNVGASGTVPAPDGVATADGSAVVRIYMQSDDNTITTPPAGHTQLFFELTIQGSDANMAIFVANSTINNGVSAGVANCVFSGNDAYIAATLIIPPAAGGTDVADVADTTGPHGAAGSPSRSASAGIGTSDTIGPVGSATGPASSQSNATARAMPVSGWFAPNASRSVSAGVGAADTVGPVGPAGSPARSSSSVIDRGMGAGSVGLMATTVVASGELFIPAADVVAAPWAPHTATVAWTADMVVSVTGFARERVDVTWP